MVQLQIKQKKQIIDLDDATGLPVSVSAPHLPGLQSWKQGINKKIFIVRGLLLVGTVMLLGLFFSTHRHKSDKLAHPSHIGSMNLVKWLSL